MPLIMCYLIYIVITADTSIAYNKSLHTLEMDMFK